MLKEININILGLNNLNINIDILNNKIKNNNYYGNMIMVEIMNLIVKSSLLN